MEEYMLPCMHKKLFGVECMGCGTQRAAYMVTQGDFVGAFKMYPAIYTTALLFAFILLHFIDKKRKYHKIIIFLAILNAIIMVFAYIYKRI
ncbi:DUF2752 domain-containing protein [Flavobacterium sp. CBA20B-1]|uniref:DUF2752 domain-containing protein n=1 Tax=Paenimyroides aestuarii TaxID=2968490 RepID=A0ABY5NRA1_9FLAO|nr:MULTISPECIES: DUF2752 domain-containing protein [Flavobacteriaceae]UUV21075.1 DUF2752 domain-containing protein [Paenimyroides aestuarii]WCM42882.1 DUF2752 domain-containing protein [Flavobacterium sp. CBA20B-1]